MTLYRQLWLAIVTSMLLALVGSLLASLLSARAYLESQLSMKNADNASALALSLSQGDPDPIKAELVVASLFDSGHYELIRIVDPVGQLITERTGDAADIDAPAWFMHALPIAAAPGTAQISSGWKQFGTVTLVSHSRFAYDALWESAYEMVGALCMAGLLGGYLGSLVLRRLRRPLDAVISQAQAITQRQFIRIDLPAVPELRQLAVAMNATVSRLKAMFEEEAARLELVRKEANFDPLTGLANRSHFMARLRQSVEGDESAGGALVLVRLAHLSDINRRMGREAADEYLRKIGRLISEAAQGDGVGARLNGADFALLLPAKNEAVGVANSLLSSIVQIASPYVDSQASAWLGVGDFVSGDQVGDVLSRVDMALATAEADKLDGVRHAHRAHTDELPRTVEQWSVQIHHALDNGWVRLISFPVVNAQKTLSHRECPLRLMFDEAGEWMPAGRFLPVAERLNLTAELDLSAVRLGLQELKGQSSLPGLAINLSASSLRNAQFVARLTMLVDAQRDLASRLWLEVSEVGALHNLDQFKVLCAELKRRGCKVGLEHYGHHFSQIGLLHELGLDYLKVDASFVRGVDGNSGNASFLQGLSTIAHNIGLQVLAEGVATQAEWDALMALGFDGATGPGVHDPAQSPAVS
ncbi:MAG: EAL domain-containing protein [Rhodoferax sp.]|nr:MAG: EAL domain-containing protein [Rhodoferax sp.]